MRNQLKGKKYSFIRFKKAVTYAQFCIYFLGKIRNITFDGINNLYCIKVYSGVPSRTFRLYSPLYACPGDW
jgi:hypothetical protein